jgi:hypothetical protein
VSFRCLSFRSFTFCGVRERPEDENARVVLLPVREDKGNHANVNENKDQPGRVDASSSNDSEAGKLEREEKAVRWREERKRERERRGEERRGEGERESG